ncbi:MAG: YfhO family protein, partial [Actinomycetota bacterium]|nr:YfhO family protein [Actinomycetota bacterium]
PPAAVVGLEHPVAGGRGTVSGPIVGPAESEVWDVDAPGGGFLRVSGNWDEGWSARVDGRPQPVLLADGVFRGVVLAPGHHQVRFTYSNVDEGRGRLVALGAAVALLLFAVPWRHRRRPTGEGYVVARLDRGGADS